jgi:hypothetical protein
MRKKHYDVVTLPDTVVKDLTTTSFDPENKDRR